MHRLTYTSSTGKVIDLDAAGAYVGTAPKLRSRVWSYELSWRSAYGVSRDAREATVDAYLSPEAADALREQADRDMADSSPGRLTFDGEWYQRTYLAKSDVSEVYGRRGIKTELTFLLLDGAWRREVTTDFYATETEDPSGLDYLHDFDYDYGGSTASRSVTVDGLVPADLKFTVYGPVTNPRITVSQGTFTNVYEADVEVPGGSRLVIDGSSYPKSIQLIGTYGEVEDKFASGLRGEGAGSGSYCFEPLRPGTSSVAWDGSFGFTMTHYQEEGEPPWSS